MRPRSQLCGPRCELVPQITSSTSAVLSSLRSARALSTVEPSRCGWICDSAPLGYLPIPRGVRQASMIRASVMGILQLSLRQSRRYCRGAVKGAIAARLRMLTERRHLDLHPAAFPEGFTHLATLDLAGGTAGQ